MAFLPQPALPIPSRNAPRVRISMRASADGKISVTQTRRVYEFLSATSQTTHSIEPKKPTQKPALASPTESSNGVSAATADPVEVREDLISRMERREKAIKADAAEKATRWEAELRSLRRAAGQSSAVASEPVVGLEDVTGDRPVQSYYPSRSSFTASLFGADDVAPLTASPNGATKPVWEVPSASAPTSAESADTAASPTVASTPSEQASAKATRSKRSPIPDSSVAAEASTPTGTKSSVGDLYAPPPRRDEDKPRNYIERLQDIVEDVVEDVRDVIEDVVDDIKEVVHLDDDIKEVVHLDDGESEEKKESPAASAKETAVTETKTAATEATETADRSIGEVIIDAIVDGVPTPEAEPREQIPTPDKSVLNELIDSGKIKNLTVTKLRRLLTENGLKTSGRKAELIARLTSFAKAK